MVICIGEVLIHNHEIEKFSQFFYSQSSLFMTDHIVTALLNNCFQYMLPECALPIFVRCGNQYDYLEKSKQFTSFESKEKVSEQQIYSTKRLQ